MAQGIGQGRQIAAEGDVLGHVDGALPGEGFHQDGIDLALGAGIAAHHDFRRAAGAEDAEAEIDGGKSRAHVMA
jgi:hypothetical protein